MRLARLLNEKPRKRSPLAASAPKLSLIDCGPPSDMPVAAAPIDSGGGTKGGSASRSCSQLGWALGIG